MEIQEVNIIPKEYNGIKYYKICFLDQESQYYSRQEINEIIKHWQEDNLLGSFAIGYNLSKNAVINWK